MQSELDRAAPDGPRAPARAIERLGLPDEDRHRAQLCRQADARTICCASLDYTTRCALKKSTRLSSQIASGATTSSRISTGATMRRGNSVAAFGQPRLAILAKGARRHFSVRAVLRLSTLRSGGAAAESRHGAHHFPPSTDGGNAQRRHLPKQENRPACFTRKPRRRRTSPSG